MNSGSPNIKVTPAREWKLGKNVYPMESSPRGKCIIINNVEFEDKDHWRLGSYVDEQRMEALFKALHFDCDVHKNLTASEMTDVLEEARKPEHHKDSDCLVVVLMSHGLRNSILGVDYAKLDLYEDVYELFSNENCPTLLGKPKIFIVQACRGHKEDSGILGPLERKDAIPALLRPDDTPRTQPNTQLYPSGCSDMYVIYATSPGYVAYRNEETGSFFLSTICEVFCQYACEEHLADMMSRVHHKDKQRCSYPKEGIRKQTPGNESFGFEKQLYFNPGLTGPKVEPNFNCPPNLCKCAIQ